MRAVILSGGFGTRLRSVTGENIPKCMVKGWFKPGHRTVPWMRIVVDNLKSHGINDITLSLHYKAEAFTNYFGNTLKYKYDGSEPLGTGGAIKNCIEGNEPILVLNGDTFAVCDFQDMIKNHIPPLTVAYTQNKGHVMNAGIYIINPELFERFPQKVFSFEKDVIPNTPHKFYFVKEFVDMGTPEGFEKAQS